VNYTGRKPRCPHCKATLHFLYIRKGNKRDHVGYFCSQCSGYKIIGHEIKKRLWAGLREVKLPKNNFENYIQNAKGPS